MIQTADVNKLKCIFLHYVKTIMEIEWYGIKCNKTDYLNNANLANLYLSLINKQCTLPYTLECSILAFIKNKGNNCVLTITPCNRITGSLDGSAPGGGGA